MSRRVAVHLHLPKFKAGDQACLSIKPLAGRGMPARPIQYGSAVTLESVTFRVQYAGWRKAWQTGRRNVHAWAVGYEICSVWPCNESGVPFPVFGFPDWRQATYRPTEANGPTFRDRQTGQAIRQACFAFMVGPVVWYVPCSNACLSGCATITNRKDVR